jgi:hypothetical protein
MVADSQQVKRGMGMVQFGEVGQGMVLRLCEYASVLVAPADAPGVGLLPGAAFRLVFPDDAVAGGAEVHGMAAQELAELVAVAVPGGGQRL